MDTSPPPFFNRGPAPLIRLTFFGLLAVLMMVLDARFHYAEPLRQLIAVAAYPLQRAALAPVDAARAVSEYFTTRAQLQEENDLLRERELKAARDLLALEALAAENARLRGLMQARERSSRPATLVRILFEGRDPFSRKVIVDKGANAGVQPGQAVIDEAGVVGQVTRVYPMLSEVTLITDKNQAIPVQVVRNGLRAVLYGSADGQSLDLRYMAANADVQNGDVLVTSGIDGIYPHGLPVAKVTRIERDTSYVFARISCTPAAGAGAYRHLLVLASEDKVELPAQAQQPSAVAPRAKRARARKEP